MLASDAGRTRLGERVRPAFFLPSARLVRRVYSGPCRTPRAMSPRPLFALVCLVALAACAPSISPLYRDYEVEPAPLASADVEAESRDARVRDRLRAALAEAGWTVGGPAAPNVISTEERGFGSWGLWRVLVSLDAVPVGDRHVRVQIHPVRRYITGGRSKIPYLGRSLRAAILPDLNEALETHGFHPVGTPRERDEEQTEEDIEGT